MRLPTRLLLLVALAPGHAAGVESRPVIAIEQVAVVDVARGASTGPHTVVIADGRIAAIGPPGMAVPPAAVRVDGRGRFLMPGLVDLHVHLFNNASRRPPNDWAFPLFVANGVTAVRDMLTLPDAMPVVARWRDAQSRGELVAPRIVAAGTGLRAGTTEDVRRQVRDIRAVGLDFVKIFSELQEPLWRAALDEARTQGLPVHGHVPADMGLLAAASAGQRSAEHLMQAYEACSTAEERWLATRRGLSGDAVVTLRDAQERAVLEGFDARACERTAVALTRTGQAQVPTLVLPYFETRWAGAAYKDDPRWRQLRPDEQARWARILRVPNDEEASLAARRWDVSRRIVKTLHAAGVTVLAGTDAPMPLVYPGHSLHVELELLVDAGLTPAEALRAATLGPAELLGLADASGTVEPGKRADLVLLDADPLARIGNTQRIHAVVLDGRLLRKPDLDALVAPGPGG